MGLPGWQSWAPKSHPNFGDGSTPVGNTITIKSLSVRVIGVTKAKGSSGFSNPDETVYVPVTTAMKMLMGQDYVQAILVEAADSKKVDQTQENLTNFMLDQHKITDPALETLPSEAPRMPWQL